MKLLLTGDAFFLRRYSGLASSLERQGCAVAVIPSGNIGELPRFRFMTLLARNGVLTTRINNYIGSFDRKAAGFAIRSRQTERKLRRISSDYVLHVFGSFAPIWTRQRRYGMYLDFTTAQAAREWTPWVDFKSRTELDRWLACEKRAYEGAESIFTMSEATAEALSTDYGIPKSRIEVVGSGGDFAIPFQGERSFGSKMILFQGSEFLRKGGDILLEAFGHVRRAIPAATLVVIGTDQSIEADGVTVLGQIAQNRVRELLLGADVVAAPARCDPFTAFVIEAMNYGTPSVVTRCSGISEKLDGGGIILERPDPTLLAEALISLLQDENKLRIMSTSARNVIRDSLNWDKVAARILTSIMTPPLPSGRFSHEAIFLQQNAPCTRPEAWRSDRRSYHRPD